jgi:hypothetical protein
MGEHDDDLETPPATEAEGQDDAARIAAAIASGLERVAEAIERGLGEIASAIAPADVPRRRRARTRRAPGPGRRRR